MPVEQLPVDGDKSDQCVLRWGVASHCSRCTSDRPSLSLLVLDHLESV
uniref:Uncharacterized protein n=1 Tax=Arundo donax TaxID=35708 RepID=A0A0A8Z285_ARUDO